MSFFLTIESIHDAGYPGTGTFEWKTLPKSPFPLEDLVVTMPGFRLSASISGRRS
jgi:hypothetical protein